MVTPDAIAVALGRPSDSVTDEQAAQWQMWIDDVAMLIDDRANAAGVVVDEVKFDYVVRQAVLAHLRNPDNATQVTVAVDDGSTSRSYRSGAGRPVILDEWWTLLGLSRSRGKAFELDTTPASPGVLGIDYWWGTPTDTVLL